MKVAVKGVIGLCKDIHCPCIQKWCAWSGNHKEMAYGMLLAQVQPWKYAIGKCYQHDWQKEILANEAELAKEEEAVNAEHVKIIPNVEPEKKLPQTVHMDFRTSSVQKSAPKTTSAGSGLIESVVDLGSKV